MDDLRRILEGRDELYRKADATLDTSGRTVGDCVDELERLARAAATA
jgi:XRE family aerobic/anaerobic benzoate catabolism transcriptional regulator